ncbi:recombinase family protein [Bradyrhizobium tropiciagri]|uniref:recombinase family protein n=1 Tax=Bradyrhizobium tropiciagri TaxID=312253 RepID=UPI00067E5567|nr:recombinase family protein [Bradyrhizobium tropiciagri]
MSKVTPAHLARAAFVYVRQSTVYQVVNNLESQRRQYGLVERARQLGWEDVQLVDDDLGRSGGGTVRPGFEKLLAAICEERVGAVVSLKASRLARNGRDWHTLLEFCGLVGTLIVDEEAIYDPRSPNDRLLLGMKGTMSEMELSIFRQRSLEAMRQKARRGELHLTVAVGYVKTDDSRIEKDPDRRVQDGILLVFRKFAELQSIRQVLLWLRQENVLVPAIVQGRGKRPVEWKAPVYHTLYHMLTNPVYAGSYAYGRRGTRVTIKDGRKRIMRDTLRRNWKDWEVLIHDHHEGYIAWTEFERNQHLIADNANGKSYMGRGSIRRGEALLPGLFRCARCGRRLHIHYTGKGGNTQRYACRGAFGTKAADNCIGFGGMRVDRVIAQEVLDRLQPLGIEAALAAMEAQSVHHCDKRRHIENAIQHAQYEAVRARRQYDAVDPDNRLVASELERRWNERLVQLRDLEAQLETLKQTQHAPALSAADRARLMTLGKDLTKAWNSPGASIETRKKIIRLLVKEIIVNVVGDTLALIIHWQGGDHTQLTVKKNKIGQTRWTVEADVLDLVRALARQLSDTAIAAILNRSGKLTAHGASWTRSSVCSLRNTNGIPVYREGERAERAEVTLDEAADLLKVSRTTAFRMVRSGTLPARQLCGGAPWIIQLADLQRDAVCREADARRSRRPISRDPQQNLLPL